MPLLQLFTQDIFADYVKCSSGKSSVGKGSEGLGLESLGSEVAFKKAEKLDELKAI